VTSVNFLDRIPRWLRWVLFLPVGLVGSMLVNVFLELLLDVVGLPNTPQTTAGLVKSGILLFFGGLTVTLFPSVLSPKPWVVGIVLCVVGVLVEMSPLLMAVVAGTLRWSSLMIVAVVNVVAYAVGACLALLLIRYPGFLRT
jgi:hypothetical protein